VASFASGDPAAVIATTSAPDSRAISTATSVSVVRPLAGTASTASPRFSTVAAMLIACVSTYDAVGTP